MFVRLAALALAAGLVGAPTLSFADSAATVTCRDGSTSKAGRGACSHHGGVGATTAAAPAAPVRAPATGVRCSDGSISATSGRGACSHHGGVASSAPAAAPAPTAPAANAPIESRAPAPSTQGATRVGTPSAPQPGQPTARCKDGTMSYAKHHSGACSHHGGVAAWM